MKKLVTFLIVGCLLLPSIAFSASTDVYFDTDTKLMLHADGDDASTTFTDSSSGGKSVTAVAQAQIDTAQSVFGGASGLFDGSGDWLTALDNDDFYFWGGDFTLDFRFKTNDATKLQGIISQKESDSNLSIIRFWPGGTGLNIYHSHTSGGGAVIQNSWSWTPTNGVWYHLALVRSGNDYKFYVDGTAQGSTYTNSHSGYNLTGTVYIAFDKHWNDVNGGGEVNGWIDEFRLVKGTAVWTSNFTPPTAAYSAAPPPSAVKTVNGLAKASVKTKNGLAVASVKTWNGLA